MTGVGEQSPSLSQDMPAMMTQVHLHRCLLLLISFHILSYLLTHVNLLKVNMSYHIILYHISSYLPISPHISSYLLISYHTFSILHIYFLIPPHISSYLLISIYLLIISFAFSEHVHSIWEPDVRCSSYPLISFYLPVSPHIFSYLLISSHISSYFLISPHISSHLLFFQSMCIPSGSPMSAAPDIMTSSTSSLQGLRKSSGARSKLPTSQISQFCTE